MRGIVVPERIEDFTADPVELFFDLAYVFAFSRLVYVLVHHPTWSGVGEAALLFALIWIPWTQFTWSANAVSGNGRMVRALFLVATAASVPMAAAVSSAFDAGGFAFAISASVILMMGLAIMVAGLPFGSPEFAATVRYSRPNLVAVAVLVVGAFLDRGPRIALWLLALAIIVGGTVAAGSDDWIIRSGHFAERHGLIIIVALGELIVAVGTPVVTAVSGGEWLAGQTLATILISATFTGLLWWGYFDRPAPALEHRAEAQQQGREAGRFARDVYTYAHAPIVAGVIVMAAALEEIVLHPLDSVPLPFRVMLVLGLAGYLLGVAVAIYRAFGVFARERLVCAVVVGLVVAVTGSVAGIWVLLAMVAVVAVTLIAEHVRIEVG